MVDTGGHNSATGGGPEAVGEEREPPAVASSPRSERRQASFREVWHQHRGCRHEGVVPGLDLGGARRAGSGCVGRFLLCSALGVPKPQALASHRCEGKPAVPCLCGWGPRCARLASRALGESNKACLYGAWLRRGSCRCGVSTSEQLEGGAGPQASMEARAGQQSQGQARLRQFLAGDTSGPWRLCNLGPFISTQKVTARPGGTPSVSPSCL